MARLCLCKFTRIVKILESSSGSLSASDSIPLSRLSAIAVQPLSARAFTQSANQFYATCPQIKSIWERDEKILVSSPAPHTSRYASVSGRNLGTRLELLMNAKMRERNGATACEHEFDLNACVSRTMRES